MAAALSAVVVVGLAVSLLSLPDPPPTLGARSRRQRRCDRARQSGHRRADGLIAPLDTLLEKVVLLLALIGVWSLAPDGHLGRYGRAAAHRSTRTARSRSWPGVLPPVGIVVGVYLVWVGADQPGGAFPGATILAAMWLLVDDGGA